MEVIGSIVAAPNSPPLDRAAWLAVCKAHKNLVAIPTRSFPNPFAPGEYMEVHASDDSVNVVISERIVGEMHWAADDSAGVFVQGDGEDFRDLVEEIAKLLSATLVYL